VSVTGLQGSFRELARLADLAGRASPPAGASGARPWQQLLRAERVAVDLFESRSRRYLVTRRVPRAERAARALTRREREVVERVGAGESNKVIAIELCVAGSTVSTHIARALGKLGLSSRIDVVRAAAYGAAFRTENGLAGADAALRICRLRVGELHFEVAAFDTAPGAKAVRLTPSEAEVQEAILRGESNADIASARRSSVRTVANQVGCVFRKWGVNSRCELAAVMAGV